MLRRSVLWRTPAGKRVRVDSTRMVSMTQRHLAVLTLEVTVLDGDAPIVISSQLLNRQDGKDEYHDSSRSMGEATDPRKAAAFAERVLEPRLHYAREDRMMLGYQCASSRMTIAVAADHWIQTDDEVETVLREDEDLTKMVFRVEARRGQHDPPGQGRGLPLLARGAGQGALRPVRPHPRPGGPARRRPLPP